MLSQVNFEYLDRRTVSQTIHYRTTARWCPKNDSHFFIKVISIHCKIFVYIVKWLVFSPGQIVSFYKYMKTV